MDFFTEIQYLHPLYPVFSRDPAFRKRPDPGKREKFISDLYIN